MTFKNWLRKNYIDEIGPEGDLARDVDRDEDFPMNGPAKYKGWHRILHDYLMRAGACYECMDVFEECWKEYELCERKRLKMALPKQ